MSDPVETPYADFTKKYAGWAGDIAGLWLPGAGIAAKLIEKAPLGELEKYVRVRARGGLLQVTQVAATEGVATVAPPRAGDGGASPVATAPQAPPAPTILEVDDLLRQYEAVRESEPFRMALGRNLHVAVTQLETFMQETALFSGVLRDTCYGLWPTFALEWKLRYGLANRLGAAAIVADHPALRSLIEADLAAELVNALMAAPNPTPQQPRTLDRSVRVFAADASYRWPRAEGFRPGYVLADVTSPLSFRNMQLRSGVGRDALARARGADAIDVTQAKHDAEMLIDRLARLSLCGRDELTRAWLRSCAASELSQPQRDASSTAPNPFLSRVEHPLIHIDRADLLDAIRDDVEASIGLPAITDQYLGFRSLYACLDALTEAYATHDAEAFDRAVTGIAGLLILESDSAIAERVGRVIEQLKHAREWK